MLRLTFPETWQDSECILVPMHTALVPYVSGALKAYEEQFIWATRADYERAYNALAELRASMQGNNCLQELIEVQNKQLAIAENTYRLLNVALNGENYFERMDPDGTITIDPPIPALPIEDTDKPNALRAHVGRLLHLAENTTSGATYPAGAGIAGARALEDERPTRDVIRDAQGLLNAGWFNIGGRPATLADIVTALRIGSDTDQGVVSDALQEILGTGSDANSIFNTIRGLFDTAANTTLEGGQLGVLLASSLANAALMAQQAKELQLLNRLLSGTTAEFGAPALTHEAVLFGFPPGGNGDKIPIGELARQTTANTDTMRSNLGAPGEADRVIPLLREIAGTIGTIGSGGGGTPAELQAVVDKLEEIRFTLSPQGPTPQLNLYYLVEGILDAVRCVCDAVGGENTDPGGGGDGPLNPEPDYACASEVDTAWLRVAEWVPVEPADGQDPEIEAYAARFEFPTSYGIVGEETVNGRPVYRFDESADELRWCEAADWTGADRPFYKNAPRGTAAFAGEVQLTGGVSNVGADTYGESQVWPTTVAQGGGAVRIGWTHYWLPGETPSLNFWVKMKPFTIG